MKPNSNLRKQVVILFGTKSNFKGVIAILKNWVAFFTLYFLVAYLRTLPFPLFLGFYIVASFLIGCSLRGFDNLTHEAAHYNIFTKHRIHDHLQFLYAFPVLKILGEWRVAHNHHHSNYRFHKEIDPDTEQSKRWGVEDLPYKKSFRQIGWFYIIRFFILYYTFDSIRFNIIPHLRNKKLIPGRLIFWGIISFIVYYTGSTSLFLLGYVIPYLLWLPYIRFITESSKHSNVNLEDDFSNSRNNIGILHQYILHPHNDGFHQMHHYAAAVPFYNLKGAYRFIKADEAIRKRLIESFSPLQTINQIFAGNEKGPKNILGTTKVVNSTNNIVNSEQNQ